MKLKKQLASLAVMGMMSLVAASSAFASGVGVVNFDTLVQSHKDFPKVSAQMQAAVKDANEQFAKKAPKMKTDQERQNLGKIGRRDDCFGNKGLHLCASSMVEDRLL